MASINAFSWARCTWLTRSIEPNDKPIPWQLIWYALAKCVDIFVRLHWVESSSRCEFLTKTALAVVAEKSPNEESVNQRQQEGENRSVSRETPFRTGWEEVVGCELSHHTPTTINGEIKMRWCCRQPICRKDLWNHHKCVFLVVLFWRAGARAVLRRTVIFPRFCHAVALFFFCRDSRCCC